MWYFSLVTGSEYDLERGLCCQNFSYKFTSSIASFYLPSKIGNMLVTASWVKVNALQNALVLRHVTGSSLLYQVPRHWFGKQHTSACLLNVRAEIWSVSLCLILEVTETFAHIQLDNTGCFSKSSIMYWYVTSSRFLFKNCLVKLLPGHCLFSLRFHMVLHSPIRQTLRAYMKQTHSKIFPICYSPITQPLTIYSERYRQQCGQRNSRRRRREGEIRRKGWKVRMRRWENKEESFPCHVPLDQWWRESDWSLYWTLCHSNTNVHDISTHNRQKVMTCTL